MYFRWACLATSARGRISRVNVAVTQGSKKARQAERLQELDNACRYLGLELIATGPNGLEQINPENREQNPDNWANPWAIIHALLKLSLPRVIMFPHEHDWNSTHIGTHFLVMDALKQMPSRFRMLPRRNGILGSNDRSEFHGGNQRAGSCRHDHRDDFPRR